MANQCVYTNPQTQKGCQFQVADDEVFPREAPKRWCEFHLPMNRARQKGEPNKVAWPEEDKDRFNQKIFDFVRAAISDEKTLDLSGTEFPGPISFKEFADAGICLPSSVFFGCRFHGEVDLSCVQFGGIVDFRSAHLFRDTKFCGAHFRDDAIFSHVQVYARLDFGSVSEGKITKFEAATSFDQMGFTSGDGTSTSPEINFSEVRFNGITNFHSHFRCPVNFRNVRFAEDAAADFTNARFDGPVSFAEARFFVMEAKFDRVVFVELVEFNNAKFIGNCSFSGMPGGRIDFTSAEFKGSVDFSNARLDRGTKFVKSRFHGPTFFFECDIHESIDFSRAEFSYVGVDATLAFMKLRHEMASRRDHIQEGRFFTFEKRCERKSLRLYHTSFWLSLLYDWTSEYGSSTGKPFIWLVFVFVVASGIYTWLFYEFAPNAIMNAIMFQRNDFIAQLFGFGFEQITRPFFIWSAKYKPLMPLAHQVLISNGFWLRIVASVHSLLSLLLLFSLGLAVRWRFRRA